MIIWPFHPGKKITESLAWLTDIIRAKAAEQRFAMRSLPRLTWQYSYIFTPAEFSRAKLMVRSIGTGELLFPRWIDMAWAGVVDNGDGTVTAKVANTALVPGSKAVLWESSDVYEELTVFSVVGELVTFLSAVVGDYTQAFIMPLEVGRLRTGLPVTRSDYKHVLAKATVLVDEAAAPEVALTYPLYIGHPVLIDPSLILRAVPESYEREYSSFDNKVGVIHDDDKYTYPVQKSAGKWSIQGRLYANHLRAFLYSVRGKWKGYWLPSWNEDLALVNDIVSADDSIVIKNIGYTEFETTRELMLRTVAGAYIFLQVIDSSVDGNGDEVLNLSAAIGADLLKTEVDKISLMTFMRFESDRADIRHAGINVSLSMPMMECPVP